MDTDSLREVIVRRTHPHRDGEALHNLRVCVCKREKEREREREREKERERESERGEREKERGRETERALCGGLLMHAVKQ